MPVGTNGSLVTKLTQYEGNLHTFWIPVIILYSEWEGYVLALPVTQNKRCLFSSTDFFSMETNDTLKRKSSFT
jgi:hypothetical protein